MTFLVLKIYYDRSIDFWSDVVVMISFSLDSWTDFCYGLFSIDPVIDFLNDFVTYFWIDLLNDSYFSNDFYFLNDVAAFEVVDSDFALLQFRRRF